MAKITIKEIAEKAGVSIGTVDRVLHSRGRVSAENEKRVRAICEEYGYSSNIVGKAMAMQKKETVIAVAVNATSCNKFSALVHEGIEQYAEEIKDYNIRFEFLDLVDNSLSEQVQILDKVEQLSPAGLIIKPIDSPIIKYKLNRLAEKKRMPIVTCTSDIEGVDRICYVGQNHVRLGRLMANTLCMIAKEPLKILIVVGPLTGNARRKKLNGFLEYIEQSKVDYEILDICEVAYDDEVACREVQDVLEKYPEANAFYMHSPDLKSCIRAKEEYGKFQGISFTFGHRDYCAEYILNGQLSFAIYEDPIRHGYVSANVMFDYLLYNMKPENEVKMMEGKIVFEENCTL